VGLRLVYGVPSVICVGWTFHLPQPVIEKVESGSSILFMYKIEFDN